MVCPGGAKLKNSLDFIPFLFRFYSILILFLFLAAGCSNWKARYYESRLDLERCVNQEYDSTRIGGDVIIDYPEGVIVDLPPVTVPVEKLYDLTGPDTVRVYFPDKNPENNFLYAPSQAVEIDLDSVVVWLRLINSYTDNNLLIQQLAVDSVRFPLKVRHHYRTVMEYRTDGQAIAFATLSGFMLGILAILGWAKGPFKRKDDSDGQRDPL